MTQCPNRLDINLYGPGQDLKTGDKCTSVNNMSTDAIVDLLDNVWQSLVASNTSLPRWLILWLIIRCWPNGVKRKQRDREFDANSLGPVNAFHVSGTPMPRRRDPIAAELILMN